MRGRMGANEIIGIYRKRAKNYDFWARLYWIAGIRTEYYRKCAIESLNACKGGKIIDLCCGTGLNFPLIMKKVGKTGKITGVDITDAMLKKAKERVVKNKWKNITLVHSDAAKYKFPAKADGVVTTLALTLSPEYDEVIKNAHTTLRKGGRFVILDFKMPEGPAKMLAPFLIFLTKPYGIKRELASRHPWESIKRYFRNLHMREFYMGFLYVAYGEKK